LMGAGRTEFLETLFGAHPKGSSGQVWVEGQQVFIRSPQDAVAAGIALVPEDRKQQGLVLPMSVRDSISLASLRQVESFGFLNSRLEASLANEYVERLQIKTPNMRQKVKTLSGGNQQKVVIAKWLAIHPKVLLLDDPTRGIDVNAKNEIYRLITELALSGMAIVMVSSELPEIMRIADRIVVLAEGRLTGEFSHGQATEELLLRAALPGQDTQAEYTNPLPLGHRD
jgi:ribose transport system ATP-binding protein